jgi:hypothetical protein
VIQRSDLPVPAWTSSSLEIKRSAQALVRPQGSAGDHARDAPVAAVVIAT